MRLQVAGAALLLVSIGAFAAGCGSGVYGSAATFETPGSSPPPSRSTALAWSPISPAKLKVTRAQKNGSPVLRVRPTKATVDLGGVVAFPGRSAKGATYQFEVLVRGSRNFPRLVIGLDANGSGVVKPRGGDTVTRRWQKFVVTGPAPSAAALEGRVYVPNWAWAKAPDSWIEIAGKIKQPVGRVSQ